MSSDNHIILFPLSFYVGNGSRPTHFLTNTIVFGLTSLIQKIMGNAQPGFTTVILILLFSSSIIMISLGIIGFYIARIYEEIKGRPKYIISRTCGDIKDKADGKEIIG